MQSSAVPCRGLRFDPLALTWSASNASLSSFMSSSTSPSSQTTTFSASRVAEKRLSRFHGRWESMTCRVACSGSPKYSERSTREPRLRRMTVRSCSVVPQSVVVLDKVSERVVATS